MRYVFGVLVLSRPIAIGEFGILLVFPEAALITTLAAGVSLNASVTSNSNSLEPEFGSVVDLPWSMVTMAGVFVPPAIGTGVIAPFKLILGG